ncbi:diphthine--ammonia ligase [Candidatus Omnitrophota bacterium]
MKKAIIASWSGGKDSCLACYKAIRTGYQVGWLLNFISREYERVCFHGVEAKLIRLQASLTGITLFQHPVSPDMKEYENEFKAALGRLKEKGACSMVFGDIYLDEHKEWVDRVCKDLAIAPIEPLWTHPAEEVIKEFIRLKFSAVVTSANAALVDKEWVGRYVDHAFLDYLKTKNICPCGENGEFHTFVTGGPLFKEGIRIDKAEVIYKEGFDKRWFLDIQKYSLSKGVSR